MSEPPSAPDGGLAPWLHRPARAAVLTDFDGTLAPIVPDPTTSQALPGSLEALGRLADRFARVAVVSGRSAAFLAERVPVPGVELFGMYGMERAEGTQVVTRVAAARWVPLLDRAQAEAEKSAPAGVRIERKSLALGLHARAAPERLPWVAAFSAKVAAETGLMAVPGKLIVELRPPVDIDKGMVVEEVAAGLDAVCFVGDDVGDLPAFNALDRLRASGLATLAVASDGPDCPPEVRERADLVVDGPAGVLAFLRRLAA